MTQPRRDTVDVLQVRFPRLYAEEAVAFLLGKLRSGESAGVCFPDMSTLNQAFEKCQHGSSVAPLCVCGCGRRCARAGVCAGVCAASPKG